MKLKTQRLELSISRHQNKRPQSKIFMKPGGFGNLFTSPFNKNSMLSTSNMSQMKSSAILPIPNKLTDELIKPDLRKYLDGLVEMHHPLPI